MLHVIRNWHQVKTRKDHTCAGCEKQIQQGSDCYLSTNRDSGQIYDSYICPECYDFLCDLPHDYFNDGEWNVGDIAIAREEMSRGR